MVAPSSHNAELDQVCSGSSSPLHQPSVSATVQLAAMFISRDNQAGKHVR